MSCQFLKLRAVIGCVGLISAVFRIAISDYPGHVAHYVVVDDQKQFICPRLERMPLLRLVGMPVIHAGNRRPIRAHVIENLVNNQARNT